MCEPTPMPASVRVLVVDDSVFVRRRLAALLAETLDADVKCVGTYPSQAEAILRDGWADAVVASCHPLDPSGTAAVRAVRRIDPSTPVIMLSNSPCATCREQCLAAGANAYLDKSHEFDRIPDLVRSLCAPPAPTA